MWTRTRLAIAVSTAVLALIDASQTWWAVGLHPGQYTEVMPAAAHLGHTFGVALMVTVGALATLTVGGLVLIDPRKPVYRAVLWGGCVALVAVKVLVVVSNFTQLGHR